MKIVTGDTPATAREIARQIGLWNDAADGERNHITGADFAAMSDEELLDRVQELKIMSRARPLDKQRLVRLLQQRGEVVAVTGDGTNDAPALKAADIGELGVVDNDADSLSGVHGGATTNGHDSVSLGGLEGLDVLDSGVGLDLGVEAPSDAGSVELVGHLSGNAKLDQIGVGADEDLLVAATLELAGDLLDGAGTMIRDGVENETISH